MSRRPSRRRSPCARRATGPACGSCASGTAAGWGSRSNECSATATGLPKRWTRRSTTSGAMRGEHRSGGIDAEDWVFGRLRLVAQAFQAAQPEHAAPAGGAGVRTRARRPSAATRGALAPITDRGHRTRRARTRQFADQAALGAGPVTSDRQPARNRGSCAQGRLAADRRSMAGSRSDRVRRELPRALLVDRGAQHLGDAGRLPASRSDPVTATGHSLLVGQPGSVGTRPCRRTPGGAGAVVDARRPRPGGPARWRGPAPGIGSSGADGQPESSSTTLPARKVASSLNASPTSCCARAGRWWNYGRWHSRSVPPASAISEPRTV